MDEKQRRLDDDLEWEMGVPLEYGSWRNCGPLPEAAYFGQFFETVSRLLGNEGRFTGGSSVEQEALSGHAYGEANA